MAADASSRREAPWLAAAAGALAALLTATALMLVLARGAAATWTSAADLRAGAGTLGPLLAGLLVGAGVAWFGRDRTDRAVVARWAAALVVVSLLGFAHPLGRHAAIVALAAAAALLVGAAWPARARLALRRADLILPVAGYVATVIPMCVFPMHRHWAFGSGSWDMGCYVHNAFLVSRFLPTISTVLGGADFIGDHFSVGLYLYAPYFWLWGSAYGLIFLQALNLAVTTPAVYAIARAHGASPGASSAVGLATGLSFGLQSAAFFDVHAITLGFGFFAAGLWAVETRRLWLATALLFVFSLFKESIGLYIVGLGLWLLLRGATSAARERRRDFAFGGAWIAVGSLWFVVVNRVIVPWFRARGSAPEPHETFTDFGPTVLQAALGVASDPLTAAWFMFVGDEKLMSWFATLANAGWLTLAAPSVLVAGLPLLAERFLSSKSSMWHMGFHYAAPLCLYAGWGAARVIARAEGWVRRRSYEVRPTPAVATFVLTMAALTLGFGYRHPSNFLEWRYAYYAGAEQRAANAAATAWLRENAPRGRVAAQNRLLPHVASRRFIYRLEQWDRADWVLLSLGEDAWPYSARFVRDLARRLDRSADWSVAFDRGGTRIYRRSAPD